MLRSKKRRRRKIVFLAHFPLDFRGTGSIAVNVDGPPGSPTRLAQNAGLVVVQASQRAMQIQRTNTMATKQPRKQAKSVAKTSTGEANKPAHNRQRTPRPRTPQARSKSAANQTSSVAEQATMAPAKNPEATDLSKNTTAPSPEHLGESCQVKISKRVK